MQLILIREEVEMSRNDCIWTDGEGSLADKLREGLRNYYKAQVYQTLRELLKKEIDAGSLSSCGCNELYGFPDRSIDFKKRTEALFDNLAHATVNGCKGNGDTVLCIKKDKGRYKMAWHKRGQCPYILKELGRSK